MKFNMEDLRKEFDALKAARDIKEEACEIGCEEIQEEEGFMEAVPKYMLAPANCGVYFSRLDIKVIGLMVGENVQVRERKRMLRDILRSVTSKESLAQLFEVIDEVAEEKVSVYRQLIEMFPASKDVLEDKIAKKERFKKALDTILAEFDEEVES